MGQIRLKTVGLKIIPWLKRRFVLQGQMLYVPETDLMLFLCYPSVVNLDDLTKLIQINLY